MVLPPALRYQLIRMKALNRPALWGLLAGLGLLVVAGHQYRQHPEWLGQFELDADNSLRSGLDPTLSPEEQAELAEIDNLSLLLNQMQPTTTAAIEQPELLQEIDETNLSLPEPDSPSLLTHPLPTTAESPFEQYLERNQFRSVNRTAQPDIGSNQPNSPLSPGNLPAGSSRAASENAPSPTSPLERALLEQRTNSGTNADTATATSQNREGSNQTNSIESQSAPGEPALPPWMVQQGSIPGVNQSFIRTTPQMSPPPGTTGYTLPPSLPVPAPTAGQSGIRQPSLPAAASTNLDLSPNRSTSTFQTTPGTTTPGTLPSPGGVGYTQPQTFPAAEPFSVPRPPGSYTGGGYIYTFSDPNGPGE
jgi:hypothetical protein